MQGLDILKYEARELDMALALLCSWSFSLLLGLLKLILRADAAPDPSGLSLRGFNVGSPFFSTRDRHQEGPPLPSLLMRQYSPFSLPRNLFDQVRSV